MISFAKPGLLWALKIMDRVAAGEHVNVIAEQYAREALGLPPKDQGLNDAKT